MNNARLISYVSVFSILFSFAYIAPGHSEEDISADKQPETEAEQVQDDNYSETYRQLNLFGDVFERVRAQYVEEKDDKELIENALNGMLSSLDPHSSYLSEDRFKDMKVETSGEFGGLGIEVSMESGLVKVVSPIDDTPAFHAGIQAGDYISKIDDEAVLGLTLSDAVKKMRGKVGEPIKLTVLREGEDAPLEIEIIRDIIRIESVRSRVENGNIGFIRITTFSQNTGSGVRKAIKDFQEELGDKLIGYVIDLRNNPGGLLEQAIEVSDEFLEKGEIVSQRGRYEEDTQRTNATPGDLANGLPIVILVNSGSASASEIVAGALQDHRRAIIMGTQTFGKGSVQTIIPLPGNGAMRLTTARYYTPSGTSIQVTGIKPDIIVEQAKIEEYDQKYQRPREADLRGALQNETIGEDEKKKMKKTLPGGIVLEDATENTEEPFDYQLTRALDLLAGLSLYGQGQHASADVVKNDETANDNIEKK